MANSYNTIEPMTLEDFYAAAEADGFDVDRDGRSITTATRGCYGIAEEEGDDGRIYVGCMRDPGISEVEMIETEDHPQCGVEK